jgi:nitroreductase
MTTKSISRDAAIRDAMASAVLAPSVHNTQPWRFVVTPDGLDISLDRRRQLAVLDPSGRQMVLSAACALFNARVSFARAGIGVTVERIQDPDRPDLLARLRITESGSSDDELVMLAEAVGLRQTNRRRFDPSAVPEELIQRLAEAAHREHATLNPIVEEADRQTVARLSQRADGQQVTNPAYRNELRSWTTDDSTRLDGVRAEVIPRVDGTADDEIPIRDFDTRAAGALPAATHSSAHQCLLILSTDGDGIDSWVHAGEALERAWLELTSAGFTASVFTQVIEEPGLRAQLRQELGMQTHPQLILRVGHAPQTARSLRRPLQDMLDDPLPQR